MELWMDCHAGTVAEQEAVRKLILDVIPFINLCHSTPFNNWFLNAENKKAPAMWGLEFCAAELIIRTKPILSNFANFA